MVVDDGRIVAAGQTGGGLLSSTIAKVGPKRIRFQPTAFPDIVPAQPDWGATSAVFRQRARPPDVRTPRVSHPPFVQFGVVHPPGANNSEVDEVGGG